MYYAGTVSWHHKHCRTTRCYLLFVALPAIPTSLSSMHASTQGHPNTSDVVRSGATEEQCQALEILRKTPSTHGCSWKDVFFETDLIFEICFRQRRQDISIIEFVSMRYVTSAEPLLRGSSIVELCGIKQFLETYPGHTQLTWMLRPAHSFANAEVNWLTAPFVPA